MRKRHKINRFLARKGPNVLPGGNLLPPCGNLKGTPAEHRFSRQTMSLNSFYLLALFNNGGANEPSIWSGTCILPEQGILRSGPCRFV
jgi:hypothetical protein